MSASAPTIALTNFGTMNTISNFEYMTYILYADQTGGYDDYYDWVFDPATTTETALQISNATDYSNYVLKITCNLQSLGTKVGSGCCLKTASMGGLCITGGDTHNTFNMYALTAAQMTDATVTSY